MEFYNLETCECFSYPAFYKSAVKHTPACTMTQLCVHTLLDWFCTLSCRTEVEGLCRWSHILKGRKKNEEEPSGSLPYVPHTLSHLTASGVEGGVPPPFSRWGNNWGHESGGHIVIPLLWKYPQFLWETIFLLYLGPWDWGGTDTDLTNQSISTTWSVIGLGMNMWFRLSQWDSIPVYLFCCGQKICQLLYKLLVTTLPRMGGG